MCPVFKNTMWKMGKLSKQIRYYPLITIYTWEIWKCKMVFNISVSSQKLKGSPYSSLSVLIKSNAINITPFKSCICNSTMSRPEITNLQNYESMLLTGKFVFFSNMVVDQETSFIVHPHILEFLFKCNKAKSFTH